MKRLSLVLVLALMSIVSFGTNLRMLDQDFNGEFPGSYWRVSGSPTWGKVSTGTRNTSWAAWCAASSMDHSKGKYAPNMAATLSFGPFDLNQAESACLTFRSKLASEAGRDSFVVIIHYPDGRRTKSAILHNQSGSSRSGWSESSYSLEDYLGKSGLRLDFVFRSDSRNSDFGGAWLDWVRIDLSLPEDGDFRMLQRQSGGVILEGGGSLSW